MVLEQFGMAGDDLLAEYGPEVLLPPTELELAEYAQARERGETVTAPVPIIQVAPPPPPQVVAAPPPPEEELPALPERPDNMTLLKIYALYKQGSSGDASGERPGMTDFVNRAKFDAWAALAGTDADTARQDYIDLIESLK